MTTTSFDHPAAVSKLDEIYKVIIDKLPQVDSNTNHLGLYSGNMGISLFLYEYAQYKSAVTDTNYNQIVELVDKAFDTIASSSNFSRTYCNGAIGTMWTVDFLRYHKVLDLDDDYIDTEVLDYLEKGSLIDTLQLNNCDLLHGGFGFWAYLNNTHTIPNWNSRIQKQLDALEKITIKVANDKINWRINKMYMSDDPDGINLGLAHGICAIIILLSKLKASGYKSEFVDESIEKGLNFIISHKLPPGTSKAMYPSTITKESQPPTNGRLAWCYGDFCLALAFWHAWKATANETYKNESLSIIDNAVKLEPKKVGIMDCGICHGTAGVAHIFRRFYWETQNETYKEAADFWIDQTLQMATWPDGYAGYKTFKTAEYGGPAPELSLLEGVAGIGLTLISAITNKKSDWDSFLLIS